MPDNTGWSGPQSPRSLARDEVRNVDRLAAEEFHLPGIVLMENAGRGAAHVLANLGIAGTVAIVCGKGNNGGDGLVVARHLDAAGYAVRVLLCADPRDLAGDAAANFRVVEAAGIAWQSLRMPADRAALAEALAQADWVVDALLGTGTQGALREPMLSIIAAINESGRRVLAIDLPSGMDCDAGQPLGACVRARHTVTFVARKRGFDRPESAVWTGAVTVVDIGVPRKLLERVYG